MEEELLKRNTDCVYFLASPFTCKKGIECEYRHSDMARLNPRDCWYWLSGSCLNPSCAFRHPPLEVDTKPSAEAAAPPLNQSSMPATKTTVPCYFYFNGFCNKGDKCPFLHEPDDTSTWRPKMPSTFTNAPARPSDTRTSGKTYKESSPARKQPSPSKMATKSGNFLQIQQKQQVQQPANSNTLQLNTFAQACDSEDEETAALKMVSLFPMEGLTKSESEPSLGSGQSSEELVDGNIIRDEWWESSPGFDVLVDGKTEDVSYEDDPEYLHAVDGNDGERGRLFGRHGCVDEVDYDERGFLGNELYEHYGSLDDEYRADLGKYSPREMRGRKVGRSVSRKRKFQSMELPNGGQTNVDLRDYLRKRRMVDVYSETHGLKHDLTSIRDERQDRPQRYAPNQRVHRRIASKVEKNGIELARRRTSAVDAHQSRRSRNSHRNGSKQYNGVRQLQLTAEGQRRSFSKRETYTHDSSTFSGPKNLAEIKRGKALGQPISNGSVDFDGPKPLSEILKDKKKTVSSGNGDTDPS